MAASPCMSLLSMCLWRSGEKLKVAGYSDSADLSFTVAMLQYPSLGLSRPTHPGQLRPHPKQRPERCNPP